MGSPWSSKVTVLRDRRHAAISTHIEEILTKVFEKTKYLSENMGFTDETVLKIARPRDPAV